MYSKLYRSDQLMATFSPLPNMSTIALKIAQTPQPRLAFSNRVYISKDVFARFAEQATALGLKINPSDPSVNIQFDRFVFQASPNEAMNDNEVGLNQLQRKSGSFTLNQPVNASVFKASANVALSGITFGIDLIAKKKDGPRIDINVPELSESFKTQFSGQVFCAGQNLAVDFNGLKLDVIVDSFDHAELGLAADTSKRQNLGQVTLVTNLVWRKQNGSQSNIVFVGATAGAGDSAANSLFRSDFDFEKMGIGGLGAQFQTMLRRAFASRIFPETVKELGINHVRGILLHGPPGCGKTLIARQIGKLLNAREPKIVNGPEILDKYVGGSEEKIRELFADAEKEQAEMGDASMLHIIIFDEMDAIMKTRGSTRDNTGVQDSIVNQLLSKIDGVDSLNNILIIGMTNRKDMIDEAILRPGRLELHIEIGLPDEAGRLQILTIHTASMRKNRRITPDALERLPELAERTKNFTGAELEGLVRCAASYALARNISNDIKAMDPKNVVVAWQDFTLSLSESVPAYGNKDADEIRSYYKNDICYYSSDFKDLWGRLERLVTQVRTSSRTPLLSVLLEGEAGTGKTALAAKLCSECDFPFVRMITAASMIGQSESEKCSRLLKVFTDAYKSPLSIIFIDDIERILEYTSIGPRFSNVVLQTLLVLVRKIPPTPNNRLMVIATTSISTYLDGLALTQAFHVKVNIPLLREPNQVAAVLHKYSEIAPTISAEAITDIASSFHGVPIAVKQLLMVLEMARSESADSGQDTVSALQFIDCLSTLGL